MRINGIDSARVIELTEQEHLDLISLHHAILLELVLNLLISRLSLLLLCAHTATHLGGVDVVLC